LTKTDKQGKLVTNPTTRDHQLTPMQSGPVEFTNLMTVFAPLFSWRVWQHAPVLLVGAIPSATLRASAGPSKRTVAALRVMGLSQTSHFQNYHRVLHRAA
jgi:hypothetical protein